MVTVLLVITVTVTPQQTNQQELEVTDVHQDIIVRLEATPLVPAHQDISSQATEQRMSPGVYCALGANIVMLQDCQQKMEIVMQDITVQRARWSEIPQHTFVQQGITVHKGHQVRHCVHQGHTKMRPVSQHVKIALKVSTVTVL